MFARSTLQTLAVLALFACGSVAAGEPLDPRPVLSGWFARFNKPLSLNYSSRNDTWLRGFGKDAIEPGLPAATLLHAPIAATSLDDADELRPSGRLSFNRGNDDERAGSSASLTLGRLNLNETRGGPALGAASQADLEREMAQLRESINRVRLSPQVSLGMRVKF